jgi:hypothetical protein
LSLLLSDAALHLDRSPLLGEPLFVVGGLIDNRGENLLSLAWGDLLLLLLLISPKLLSNAISSCQADGIWALSTTMSMGLVSNCWRNEFICCVKVGWAYYCLDYDGLLVSQKIVSWLLPIAVGGYQYRRYLTAKNVALFSFVSAFVFVLLTSGWSDYSSPMI